MESCCPCNMPKFSKNIWLLALFGFFLSASTQMLYSHLALFLRFDCDATYHQIATIDGVVEFLSYLIRIFSGAVSDYLHDRKLPLLLGCFIVAAVKPIFAVVHSTFSVFLGEIAERLACGLQAAPRDALIADVTNNKNRLGASFGLCKSVKTAGGMIGAGLALAIVCFSDNNYRLLFALAGIPAIFAFLCVSKIEISAPTAQKNKNFDNPFQKKYLKSLDSNFWHLILLAFLCELGHIGDSLLTIRGSQLMSQAFAGATSIAGSVGQVFFAYFLGLASDRINKMYLLSANVVVILISYVLIFATTSAEIFLVGVVLLQGQFAAIQLIFLALINQHVAANLRGTAIGVYYAAIGLSYMICTQIAAVILS